MDITGEYTISAPRDVVWHALNDPEVLKRTIPGCKELEQRSPTDLAAKVTLKIGPISATFNGNVTLENLDPPASYDIVGQGQGGAAGFAKGRARVELTEVDADTTKLVYTAKAEVGGKLADSRRPAHSGDVEEARRSVLRRLRQGTQRRCRRRHCRARGEKEPLDKVAEARVTARSVRPDQPLLLSIQNLDARLADANRQPAPHPLALAELSGTPS